MTDDEEQQMLKGIKMISINIIQFILVRIHRPREVFGGSREIHGPR